MVKDVQAELDKRTKLEKLPPKPSPTGSAAPTSTSAARAGDSPNKSMARLIAKQLRALWGRTRSSS